MNSNNTKEPTERTNHDRKERTPYLCADGEVRALLGIDALEERMRSLSDFRKHPCLLGEEEAKAREPGSEIFGLPIVISAHSLLEDLNRIFLVFDKERLTAKDWNALEQGFLDLMFVKYRMYCGQMAQQGRDEEAQSAKRTILSAIDEKLHAHQRG